MKKTAKECAEECQSIEDGIELLEKEIRNLQDEVMWLNGKKKGIWWTFLCKKKEDSNENI